MQRKDSWNSPPAINEHCTLVEKTKRDSMLGKASCWHGSFSLCFLVLWNIHETCYNVPLVNYKPNLGLAPMFLNPPKRNPPISQMAGGVLLTKAVGFQAVWCHGPWGRNPFFIGKPVTLKLSICQGPLHRSSFRFHNQSLVSSRILSLLRCLLDSLELLSYRSLASLNIYTYNYMYIYVDFY